jgi:hypothetical protein
VFLPLVPLDRNLKQEDQDLKQPIVVLSIAAFSAIAVSVFIPKMRVHAQSVIDNTAVRGTYGFTEQSAGGSNTSLVGLGLLTADGAGNICGYETLQVLGQGTQMRKFQGLYSVNPDGTGTMTVNYAPDPNADPTVTPDSSTPSATYSFVVVNNRLSLKGIRTANGVLVTSEFTKQ